MDKIQQVKQLLNDFRTGDEPDDFDFRALQVVKDEFESGENAEDLLIVGQTLAELSALCIKGALILQGK